MGSLFISNPFERGLNRDGRLFERRWGGGGLFNLEKMIVSVLHKGLEYKLEKKERGGINFLCPKRGLI